MAEGTVKSIPAPVGGWNTRDSLADMPENHASILDNLFPNNGRVEVRPGYSEHATTLGGNVETLAEFINGSVRKLIAFANNKIWDVTAAGAGTDRTNGMTITMNQWQYANMDGKMGLVNGTDAPLQIAADGITVSTMTLTGPTAANVIGINVYNSRSYFWEDDSQDFWYSAVNTLGGTLTKFPLSRVGQFGGKLINMATWTRDGGDGMNDMAVFLMSSGQVVVYNGTNPNDEFWSLVGIFKIGSPISRRGTIKLGGDLIIITKDGYISLSKMISKGRIGNDGLLSTQINPTVIEATKDYGSTFGWEVVHYPIKDMLLFNVPVSQNTTYHQHVFNTNTLAPCRFTNIAARCWGMYNDDLYFGGNASVYKIAGNDDNGASIDCDCQTANTYLGSKAQEKQVTAVQPHTVSGGRVAINVFTESDYKIPDVSYRELDFTGGSSDWDTATWDTAEWSSGNQTQNDWYGQAAIGYSFSSRFKIRAKGQEVRWYALNYLFNKAGLI